jgi:YD repeat-containing protein
VYDGLDRFGRVIDMVWRDYGSNVDAARIKHAYDRASNRKWREVPVAAAQSPAVHCDDTYTYGAWNRLVKVVDGSNTVAEYAYDGTGRRTLTKVYSGGTFQYARHFLYSDNWQVLEERKDSQTRPDRQFVWGIRSIDDLLLRDRDADGSASTGNLGLAGSGLEECLYGQQDPNWNVIAIADSNGDVQERYSYSAYGIPTFRTAAFDTTPSSFEQEVLYAGCPLTVDLEPIPECSCLGQRFVR